MFKAINIAIDGEPEFEGLEMLAVWLDGKDQGYISITRELAETDPDKRIYLEWNDQTNYSHINQFSYEIENGILKFNFDAPSIPSEIRNISVDISSFSQNEIANQLDKILDSTQK